MIGRLQRVPLREVWRHEAWDFTTWLEENIDLLEEELGLEFSTVEREQSAGSFNVDLVAEDGDGNTVIIENQLEKSDHDHLGKLITYLAAFNAQTAIWIVSDPRPEHTAAIAWLNQSTPASFYLIKMEAVQIGESSPAPLLTLIVGSSPETRAVAATKQEIKEEHERRLEFWRGLLELANQRSKLHSGVSPTKDNWLPAGSGISRVTFIYRVRSTDGYVELNLDLPESSQNRSFFERLLARKPEIEEQFGSSLLWDDRENRKSCKVTLSASDRGYRHREDWPEVYEAMVDAMIRFEAAFRPHLERIRNELSIEQSTGPTEQSLG